MLSVYLQANKNTFCHMKSKNTLLFSIVSFLIISTILASCSEECETDDSQSSIPERSIIKRGLPDGLPQVMVDVNLAFIFTTTRIPILIHVEKLCKGQSFKDVRGQMRMLA